MQFIVCYRKLFAKGNYETGEVWSAPGTELTTFGSSGKVPDHSAIRSRYDKLNKKQTQGLKIQAIIELSTITAR